MNSHLKSIQNCVEKLLFMYIKIINNNIIREGMVEVKKFHQKPTVFTEEVSINVMNLEKSIAFYKNIIGFQVLQQTDRIAILTANGHTPLLTLEQPPNVFEK